jgi:hypothetical protein
VTVWIGTHGEHSYTYVGKKSAMKQWLLREESKHIGRHDACNDRNVTRAIFDEVRSKRAERLLQEWTSSNRSRNLTQYLIYAAPTQSHTCRKVAEFKLAANWTNEGCCKLDGELVRLLY